MFKCKRSSSVSLMRLERRVDSKNGIDPVPERLPEKLPEKGKLTHFPRRGSYPEGGNSSTSSGVELKIAARLRDSAPRFGSGPYRSREKISTSW